MTRVAHAVEPLRFSAGQVIAREGEAAEALFVVASGSVRVSKEDGDDKEQVVILSPGQHVGEVSLLDGSPRSASIIAAEASEIFRLPWEKLSTILESDPRLAANFYRALAQVAASRLRATTDDITFLKHLAREAALKS